MGNPIEVRKVPILKVTDASGMEELIDKGVSLILLRGVSMAPAMIAMRECRH